MVAQILHSIQYVFRGQACGSEYVGGLNDPLNPNLPNPNTHNPQERRTILKALKGRVIVDIIPLSHTRDSGLLIIDRKEVSSKGKVISVGAESMTVKQKPIIAPCKKGDTIHFKKFTPMFHDNSVEGMKKGRVTLFWEDITAIEDANSVQATYDNVIIICKSKATTSSTLVIPEHLDTMEHTFKGEVVSVGPDFPDELNVGDTIIYPRCEGIKVIVGDETYLKLKMDWVLGVEHD